MRDLFPQDRSDEGWGLPDISPLLRVKNFSQSLPEQQSFPQSPLPRMGDPSHNPLCRGGGNPPSYSPYSTPSSPSRQQTHLLEAAASAAAAASP